MAVKGNIVATDRHALQDEIPLRTPYTLAIDPCNLCNFRCKFCAMQTVEEQQSYKKLMMPYDLFCKIIDDIAEFPDKLKVLRINGQGEPTLNPRFCDMVKYAKQKNVSDWIETITNGSQLEPELNQKIADSEINRVRISIESITEQGYKDTAGVDIDFERFIDNIRDLHERCRGKTEIYIKTVDASVPDKNSQEKFYELFSSVCDRIFIDKVIPMWSDFDEINNRFKLDDKKGMHGQKIKQVMICPYPFYSLIINADGDVTACCADWKRKLSFGSLKDIWSG